VATDFSQEQAQELVYGLFVSEHSARYQRLDFGNVVETIIPNTLFRFGMEHPTRGEITLQLYHGLGDLGGRLWEQEVHALLRLSSSPHPALPTIIEGDFDDDSSCGFVLSETTTRRLESEDLEFLWENPLLALRSFALLTDAVRQMHAHGLMHRNIWLGSLEPIIDSDEAYKGIRLGNFEMSNLVSNLLRTAVRGSANAARRVAGYYQRGGVSCLLCCPRERLAFIFPSSGLYGSEDFRSDIFSLGIIGFHWFLGMHAKNPSASASDASEAENCQAILASHKAIRAQLIDETVPRELRDLLLNMLDDEAIKRYTASEVVDFIGRHYENITSFWRLKTSSKPLLLSISESQVQEAFRDRIWISDISAEADFAALKEVIEKDLRGATLVFSPTGASPYLHTGNKLEMALCHWVIIGLQAVYFCQEFMYLKGLKRTATKIPWGLHVRYTVNRNQANLRRLSATPFRRTLPQIRVVSSKSADLSPDAKSKGHPHWTPFLKDVETESRSPGWDIDDFKQGIDWLLTLERTRLQARQYPFIRKSATADGSVTIEFDQTRDNAWREKRPLLHLLAADPVRRPPFGDFFDTLADRDLSPRVSWQIDFKGEPSRSTDRNVAVVSQRVNAREIEIRPLGKSGHVPSKGWLRPLDDWASEILLNRQLDARTELFENSALLKQLYTPHGIRGPRTPWKHASGNLKGSAAEMIPEILSTRPFFALQGPPGSGKTTVVTAVVLAFLRRDFSGRVLISSQSHFSLDELADRIKYELFGEKSSAPPLDRAESDIIMIRVGSEEAEQNIRPTLREFFPERLAATRIERIKRSCASALSRQDLAESLRPLVQRWRDSVDGSVLEIRDRLWRGANIVFATCGASTEKNLGVRGAFNRFDWVIVEEAAKAWPIELAMPLVHGNRWLLIGDHKQLPPYKQREVMDLLSACQRSARPDLKELVAPSREFLSVFQLFANLFGEASYPDHLLSESSGESERWRASILTSPARALDRQFRMHQSIARVVSHVFYADKLDTDQSADTEHGFTMPDFIAGRPLVWLDTSRISRCLEEERQWKNHGEAEVVADLLGNLSPDPLRDAKGRQDRIAVLTPYWDHFNYLSQLVPDRFRDFIYTVDSFQGRQADIVIVSLVRSNYQPEDAPFLRLGHLADEERINVMLSRARKLLICVGNFEHFSHSLNTPWPSVCKIFIESDAKTTLEAAD
jgi:serine/threonine protein kinase